MQRRVSSFFLATLAIVSLACSSKGNADTQAPTVDAGPSAIDAPVGPPGSHTATVVTDAMIAAAIGKLDAMAADVMTRSKVPGMAIAVVHKDKMVYAKGFGVRKVGAPDKVDENTVFLLASVSKPIGAAVIATAIKSGGVTWDDPLVKHMPDFALSDPYVTANVTIGDMYTHVSGLPDHAGDLLEDVGYDRAEVLKRLRYEPLTPFRAVHEYTNFGMTAGAEAVARAKKTTWEELSKTALYDPLGMTSTSSRFSEYDARPNKAVPHVKVAGNFEAKHMRMADPQSPAGGVSSSVADMAKWMRFELAGGTFEGKPIADLAALLAARSPQSVGSHPATIDTRAGFYGYGVNVGTDQTGRVRLSHSGAFSLGVATSFTMIPSLQLGIVVLTNGEPMGAPEAITLSFCDEVEESRVTRDWLTFVAPAFAALSANHSRLADQKPPASPKPPLASTAYQGKYGNDYVGEVEVVAKGAGLAILIGPKKMELPLTHWDGNTYSYLPPGENGVGITAVDFEVGTDGNATSITLENFHKNELGVLKRAP